ncbi:hypothetical protein [Streptomyces vinaceus]
MAILPALPMRRRAAAAFSAGALLVPVLAACSSSEGGSSASSPSASVSGVVQAANLTVLAAASLTDVFKQAGAA